MNEIIYGSNLFEVHEPVSLEVRHRGEGSLSLSDLVRGDDHGGFRGREGLYLEQVLPVHLLEEGQLLEVLKGAMQALLGIPVQQDAEQLPLRALQLFKLLLRPELDHLLVDVGRTLRVYLIGHLLV